MALAGGGQEGAEELGLLDVVEHQKPALACLQRGTDAGDQLLLVSGRGIEAEGLGERAVVGSKRSRVIGSKPPNQAVIGEVAVGKRKSKLALANPP